MKKRYYLFILLCLYISKLMMEIRYGDASDSAEVRTYMAKAAEKSANKNEGERLASVTYAGGRKKQDAIENTGAEVVIASNTQSINHSVNYNPPSVGDDNGFTASAAPQQHIGIPVFSSVNSNTAVTGSTEMPVAAASSSAQPQILASLSGGSIPASISGSGGPSAGYSNMDALILSSGLFDGGGGNYTTMDDDDPGGDDPFPGDTSDPVPLDGGLTFLLAVGMGLGMRSFRLTKTKKGPVKESFRLLWHKIKGGLNTKLFQVMVCMFPHGKAPFTGGKFSK